MRAPVRIIPFRRDDGFSRPSSMALQASHLAALPGTVGEVWALPNAHGAPGFPRGAVFATDPDEGGVVVAAGAGTDINCGIRAVALALDIAEVEERLGQVAEAVAAAVFRDGSDSPMVRDGIAEACRDGARFAVARGAGTEADLTAMADGGRWIGADPALLNAEAAAFGKRHFGALGGGNHFVEIASVDAILDIDTARRRRLAPHQTLLLVHAGSRGVGQCIATEYARSFARVAARYLIRVPDRTLHCAPVHTHEAREFFGAMAACVNFAYASRQAVASNAVAALESAMGMLPGASSPVTLTDIGHNTVRLEIHEVHGARRRLCVHRRGAVRTARRDGEPELFALAGHCFTASYLCAAPGDAGGAFGSAPAHAGWAESAEERRIGPPNRKGVHVESARQGGTGVRSVPRDVHLVADAAERAGLLRRVATLRPVAVIRE